MAWVPEPASLFFNFLFSNMTWGPLSQQDFRETGPFIEFRANCNLTFSLAPCGTDAYLHRSICCTSEHVSDIWYHKVVSQNNGWLLSSKSGVVAIPSVKVTSVMLVVCGSGSPFSDPSMEVANFVCLPLVYLNNKGITWKERAPFFTFPLPPFSKPSVWNFGVFASSSVIVGFIRDWNSIWRSKAFQSSIPLLVCLDTGIHFGNSQAVLSAACYFWCNGRSLRHIFHIDQKICS